MTGPVLIKFGVAASEVNVGYSEDGVPIDVQAYFDPIPSDDFGGRVGPPSDSQIVGGIAVVNIPLTKYEKTVIEKLSSFQASSVGTAGVFPTLGSFIRQDSIAKSLVLAGVNETITFSTAYLRRNFEFNAGLKWRRYMLGFECWMATASGRVLYTIA